MVFTRFLGCTDSLTHSLTDSLGDKQTQFRNASGTIFQWWQTHKMKHGSNV